MEVKSENNVNIRSSEENKYFAQGLCFGAGLGIIIGTVINQVSLGLTAGATLGVVFGTIIDMINKK